ncbi:hypothetical protein CBR_g12354 [Chara braunii]|uniref:Folate receptor-like domain-containing protein n=1 Tax=Chara braunii TaxID=69332 RepID=A0A388KRW8_CHABU|nr:hypothetical protein CBR_g12354 [Chara braunii]|eukprot:GBG72786.1 hypothetical protein CBR_g12354 [Chara braunii]
MQREGSHVSSEESGDYNQGIPAMSVRSAVRRLRGIFMKGLCLGIILWIFHVPVVVSPAKQVSDLPGNVCISKSGHFPPFSIHGKPPQRMRGGADDLSMCRIFRSKTCCSRAQTDPVLVALRRLAGGGEASEECMGLWEALQCSICDPTIGVLPGLPVVCSSLCNRVYDSCGDAFFAADLSSQALAPCGPKDTICARGNELAANGTDFCGFAGFRVVDVNDQSTALLRTSTSGDDRESFPQCFDGKPLEIGLQSPRNAYADGGQTREIKKRGSIARRGLGRNWKCLWRPLQGFGNVVTWAFGGLVLILMAGASLLRKRLQGRASGASQQPQETQTSLRRRGKRPYRRTDH